MAARRASAACLGVVALAIGAGGCGSDVAKPIAAVGGTQPRGSMTITIPVRPGDVDPLRAMSPIDALVSRQLFEPLVEKLSGPYGDARRRPGLAVSLRPAKRKTQWRIRLRPSVRFQDGLPLDSSAVVANAARWRTTAAGRALLPGLTAADAPRPDLVRLFFDHPVSGVPRLLASTRLGIVSPAALTVRSGAGADVVHPAAGAGTGAFELRRKGSRIVLARYTHWWGTSRGFGPALDQIELRVVPEASERVRLLRRGETEAAWSLPAVDARQLRHDPLLTGIPAPNRRSIGLERSVRGIAAATPPPVLSAVWLTTIGTGS